MTTHLMMPFGNQHNRLENIVNGKDDVTISVERLGEELSAGEDLKELSFELYEIEKEGYGAFGAYVFVEKPEEIDGSFYIRKFLTQAGQQAYDALKVGMVWNAQTKEVDILATEKLYDDMLRKGEITRHYAELVANCRDERLKDLRGRLVYFKLKAKEINGKFVEIKDAA